MKRNWMMLMGAAVMAAGLMLSGCGKTETNGKGPEAGPGQKFELKKVGFSQIGAESDWRKANTQSVMQTFKDAGIEVVYVDADGKSDKQISDVRSLINAKVDLIVLAPLVKTGWESVLSEAKKAQIPVIIEDRKATIPEDLYEGFIGSDFVDEGKRAAKWLGQAMPNGANLLIIEGQPGSDAAEGRKQGFQEVISKEYPKITVVKSQTGQFDRAEGKKVMAAALASQDAAKPINAVFAHNDDMALGAIEAIKDAGKKPGTDIIIISVDGIKAAFEAMVRGELNATIECNPLLGPQLLAAAKKVANGDKLNRVEYSNEKDYEAKETTKEAEVVTDKIVSERKY